MTQNDDYILEILQETGLITKSQIERARSDRRGNETAMDAMIREGVMSQEDEIRALATHVDVTPRHNLGGLKTESMDLVGKARRPVTSGEIQTMFASI